MQAHATNPLDPRTAEVIHHTATKLARNPAFNDSDVDDIAQEVYLHAFRNLEARRPDTEFIAWLKWIARNRAISHARSVAARSRRERAYASSAVASKAADAPEDDHAELRILALRACVEDMPDGSKSLLRDRYASNATFKMGGTYNSQA